MVSAVALFIAPSMQHRLVERGFDSARIEQAATRFSRSHSCAGVAAQDAPKENKGYTALKTVVIDLGAEIPSMAGW